MFLKKVEIIVEKAKNTGNLHFHLFTQRSQKSSFLTLSQTTNFADDNFTFDENCRNLLKWVENTAGKGEIARYEQFLLFPQCFQKVCTADT